MFWSVLLRVDRGDHRFVPLVDCFVDFDLFARRRRCFCSLERFCSTINVSSRAAILGMCRASVSHRAIVTGCTPIIPASVACVSPAASRWPLNSSGVTMSDYSHWLMVQPMPQMLHAGRAPCRTKATR